MGSVYRPTYVNRAGERVEVKTYRIAWVDEHGARQTEKAYRDYRSSEDLLRKKEERVEQIRSGKINAGAAAPWRESLEIYVSELRRLGRSEEYLKEIERALTSVFAACGWTSVGDVSSSGLTAFLGTLAQQGRAPRTVNHYRDTLAGFMGFAVRQGWVVSNPVDVVPKASLGSPGDTTKRPHARRALTVDEFRALVAAAPKRAALYQLAAFSGLRHKELHLLEKQDASFVSNVGTWHLRPEITKGKRLDVVPMTPDAVEVFKAMWAAAPLPTSRFFPRKVGHWTFDRDIKRAGIAKVDHRGRLANFHSLRYFFCTAMGLLLPIQIVRVLMRHRDIRTTCSLYMDLGIQDVADRLHDLPRIMPPEGERKGESRRKRRSRGRKCE